MTNEDSDQNWRKFVFGWMGLSLVLHLITAVFSIGHHSADEYFQILEFLNYKLGRTPLSDLPVEFGEQMRPWLQPGIYYCFAKVFLKLGFDNPFGWAMSFRMFAGLVGWVSTCGLALASRYWFKDFTARRWVVVALALIWFFPALHVRPSSESLAGSTFLVGLALSEILRHRQSSSLLGWALVGMNFGLSFESRFQMGFMIFGAIAWLVLIGRMQQGIRVISLRSLGMMGMGFMAVFSLGRFVDSWAYGQWVLSPWNYLSYNLIRGEVNRYTHLPWWDFLRMSFTESWPFLGLVVSLGSLVAWVRHPLSLLTWSQVPFFVVHEFIAHKELRFFFPIAMAAPVLLVMAIYNRRTGTLDPWFTWLGSSLKKWPRSPAWARYFGAPFWYFLILNNLIALAVLAVLPFARNVQFYQYLSQETEKQGEQQFVLFTLERDPFEVLGSNTYFYRPKNLVVQKAGFSELNTKLQQEGELWLFLTRFELPSELPENAQDLQQSCRPVFRTLPVWIKKLNIGGWVERAQTWSLFHCKK